jgi:anti-anti-sigma factor
MTAVDTSTLAPSGELCEDTIHVFEQLLSRTADPTVVIDLRDVTIFSAAAMRVVVRARARGIDVRLVNPTPLNARALEAGGLGALVTR